MAKVQKIEKPRAEWGSDIVVDLLKAFEIEYIAINPGVPFLVYAPLLILSALLLAAVGRETLVR